MNKVNFNNIITYNNNLCTKCNDCIKSCETYALNFKEGVLTFNKDLCTSCKKCIYSCKPHALLFNVNINTSTGNNLAIVPYNANLSLLQQSYKYTTTTLIGEKIKVIETAFLMENETSKRIEEESFKPLIISDIPNLYDILKIKYDKLKDYVVNVKDPYYITAYVKRLLINDATLKVDAYGIGFDEKMYYSTIKMIDNIVDIPFKNNYKYNILDILSTYKNLCHLDSDTPLNNLVVNNNKIITLSNKYYKVKLLLTKSIDLIRNINIEEYDFIFILSKDIYILNDNLLKDEKINNLYKKKLKSPLKVKAFFKGDI